MDIFPAQLNTDMFIANYSETMHFRMLIYNLRMIYCDSPLSSLDVCRNSKEISWQGLMCTLQSKKWHNARHDAMRCIMKGHQCHSANWRNWIFSKCLAIETRVAAVERDTTSECIAAFILRYTKIIFYCANVNYKKDSVEISTILHWNCIKFHERISKNRLSKENKIDRLCEFYITLL